MDVDIRRYSTAVICILNYNIWSLFSALVGISYLLENPCWFFVDCTWDKHEPEIEFKRVKIASKKDHKYDIQNENHNRKQSIWNKMKRSIAEWFEKKPMSAEERLTLSWLDKWRQYKRFPWKFIIHVSITILCSIMVILIFNF